MAIEITAREALAQVLQLLPQLTDHGRQEVKKHLNALSQFSQSSNSDNDDDWLLQGVIHETTQRGLVHTIPPRFKIKNESSFFAYAPKSARVRQLIEEAIPEMGRLQKLFMGKLCARVLATYLSEYRSVSFTALLGNVQLVPEALDKSFPGYIQANMLKALLPQKPTGRLTYTESKGG